MTSYHSTSKAAFDKAPHKFVIEALVDKGVRGKALSWYASFLTERSQQVKIGEYLSATCSVQSGVIQEFTCGPGLYTVLADFQFKFMADVTTLSQAFIQSEINVAAQWSEDRLMPLSIEKCGILHCGSNQPHYNYNVLSSQ